jgi:DMSO/TMAO reductase YedYZ molybdopterin-dependent catalytic subunit
MWLTRITLMAEDRLGFWEKGYYSNTADPWRNERYRLLQSGLDIAH